MEALEPDRLNRSVLSKTHCEAQESVVDRRVDDAGQDRCEQAPTTKGMEHKGSRCGAEREIRGIEDSLIELAPAANGLSRCRQDGDCHRCAGVEEKGTRENPDRGDADAA